MRYKTNVDGLTERIRELICSTDDSIQSIASEMGLAGYTVSSWLNNGTNPSAYAIVQLCKHFNVSADWLLGLSDKKERT